MHRIQIVIESAMARAINFQLSGAICTDNRFLCNSVTVEYRRLYATIGEDM